TAAGALQRKPGLKHGTGRSDRLSWKWRGAATDPTDLGAPVTGAGSVPCLFDASGAAHAVWKRCVPGGSCQSKPCWGTAGSSLKYKNRLGTPGGVVALKVKPGIDGQ